MKGLKRDIQIMVLAALLTLLTLSVSAESTDDLVAEGNQNYSAGDFSAALDSYDAASVTMPESPELYFNKGTAFFGLGEYDKARDAFEQAALKTRDIRLQGLSQYNLGNCAFRESERQQDSDLQKALEHLERSVSHYRDALKSDPGLTEAAYNIEVARLTMRVILDEIQKQQEEAEKQRQEAEKLKESLDRLVEKQEQHIEDTRQAGEQETHDQKGEPLAADQEHTRQETQELADQIETPPDEQGASAKQQAKQHVEDAAEKQEEAEQRLRENALSDAQDSQEEALDELRKAREILEGAENQTGAQEQQQSGQGDDQKSPQHQQDDEGEEKGEEQKEPFEFAPPEDKSAENILAREQENRERRAQQVSGGYRAVDRDW